MNHLECNISKCKIKQRAEARKYDVNLTWQFAEIEPDVFALYNPIRRTLVAIGTFEEILSVYRAREPYVHKPRPAAKPVPSGLTFNI